MAKRIEVLSIESGHRLILTELPHRGTNGLQTHLQVTLYGSGSSTQYGASGVLNRDQAQLLETALHNWLNGRTEAA